MQITFGQFRCFSLNEQWLSSEDCKHFDSDWLQPRADTAVIRKLQALVYDILPPTTAMVDYAIGLEKLSANEQFFEDAQTAVSL